MDNCTSVLIIFYLLVDFSKDN